MDGSQAVPSRGSPVAGGPERPRPGNRLVWSAAGIGLGLILLYAATRQVEWAALNDTLKRVIAGWAVSILGIVFAFVIIKAWRWKLLLPFLPDLKVRELHRAVYIGLAANFLVAHMGEFLRTMTVCRRIETSFSGVFASVLVERALDFIALLMLLSLFGMLAPDTHPAVKLGSVLSAMVVAAAVIFLHLVLRPPAWLVGIADKIGRRLPDAVRGWLTDQLALARPGLASIRDLRRMASAIMLSVLQWSLIVTAIWWSALAVGQPMSLTAGAVTFVLIVLGLTLPNAPMQVGATQLAFTIGLGVDGTDATAAVAASVVYTAFLILPVMLIGGAYLVRTSGRTSP